MNNTSLPVKFSQRVISWLVIGTLVWQPVVPAVAAAITPNGQTTMDKAANGVPVVNIAKPNTAGISHNQFKDYNVGKEGLILNNATGQLTQTQLGGLVQNNPNLRAGQEARGIINEVTGANRSQLQGYTEVAGRAANVMVANPYGITCNGCGFINTPQATLTTGKPQFDANGNLSALDVSKGTITVEGKGLDASASDALSLISRATEVNAAIHAKDLTVTTGANRVGADGRVTPVTGEGPAPVVAVDTGALGGMYANRIHLVSSDKGVGVNLGNLNARQGDISLTANGRLTVKDSLASGSLLAQGDNVTLSGSHKAGGDITVNGTQDIALQKATLASDGRLTLNATGNTTLTGSSLTSGGEMSLAGKQVAIDAVSQANTANNMALAAQNITQKGALVASGNIHIRADHLDNDGTVAAKAGLTAAATLTNSGTLQGQTLGITGDAVRNRGTLLSGSDTRITVNQFDNQGTVAAKGGLTTTATTLTNNGTLQGQALAITADTLQNSGTLAADNALRIDAGMLTTDTDSVITGQRDVTLNAQKKADINGQVNAGGKLEMRAGTLTSRNGAQLQSGSDIALTADNAILNGTQAAKGALSASAKTLIHGGKSNASAFTLTATEGLTNSGTLVADTLSLLSPHLSNSGLLQGSRLLDLQTDLLDNLTGGTLYSAQNLTFTIPELNNSGLITSDGNLHFSGSTLVNEGEINGLNLAGDYLSISNHSAGRLLADGLLDIRAGNLTNAGLLAANDISARATTLHNQGDIQGYDALTLDAPELLNDGRLLSAGDVSLSGQRLENNGVVQGKNLTSHQNSITNNGSLIGLERLTLDAQQMPGNLAARLAMAAPQLQLINGVKGALLTQGALDITAGTVNNKGVWQGNTILLAAQSLDNQGALQSADALSIVLSGNLTSGAGSKISAQGNAALQALALTNQGAWRAKSLLLKGEALTNGGAISGTDGLMATLSGTVTQQATGSLASNGTLNLSAAALDNSGKIQGGETTIIADRLSNSLGGEITSGQGMTLNTATLLNYGLIQGAGETRVNATSLANNSGKLVAGGRLTLTTPQYSGGGWLQATNLILNAVTNSANGTLLADEMTLSGDTFTNQGITQANNLVLNYRQLTNKGTLLGNSQLKVNATQVDQAENGKLFSGGDLLLGATGLNALGQIVALGNLTLNLANAFTGKTAIAAGNTLAITSNGAINNQSVMQGQAVNLSAGGQLTNSGQITTGSGASSLSGSAIVLNTGSSLQGNGDITLTSRGNIMTNAFAGTTGNLTLTASGAIVNTALLYAANNLALYANSITNQRGDILAGNNLWMQRDAAGNANSEVVNTSGTIETTRGDITIKTGHLLNQRDGFTVTTNQQTGTGADSSPASLTYRLSSFDADEVSYSQSETCTGGGGKDRSVAILHTISGLLKMRV